MNVVYPDYYRDFRCIAGECPDTCCGGWKISIDDRTWKTYRRQKGDWGRKLRRSMDRENRSFLLEGGFCPFLDEEKLCGIQKRMGEKNLCRTCRDYPRHMEVYDGLKEVSLSLSCPEAARLILKREKPSALIKKENPGEERTGKLLELLLEARGEMFGLLDDRSLPYGLGCGMALAIAHDMQSRLDRESLGQARRLLRYGVSEKARQEAEKKTAVFYGRPEERRQYMAAWMEVLGGLETISASWPERRVHCLSFLQDRSAYEKTHEKFLEYREKNRYVFANLMIYFLYVYFLGAVYDGNVYGKAKFAAVSCLAVQAMSEAVLAEKGELSEDDLIEAAYIYSREMEHSDNNLEGVEEILMKSGLFSMEKIFVCLFS